MESCSREKRYALAVKGLDKGVDEKIVKRRVSGLADKHGLTIESLEIIGYQKECRLLSNTLKAKTPITLDASLSSKRALKMVYKGEVGII